MALSIMSFIADIATLVMAIIAIAELKSSKKVRIEENDRRKKEATLNAINVLQKEVFDEMNEYSAEDMKAVADDIHCKGYKHFSTLLARCEHFCVGIENGIYDYETAKKLSGSYLFPLYRKFIPIIEAKRQVSKDQNIYSSFQEIASSMKKEIENEGKSNGSI